MSAKIWTGASTGVFSTAGNWTSGAPAAADVLYDQETSTRAIAGSDETGTGTFAAFYIKMTNLFAVGDLATPLKMACTLVDIGLPSNSSVTAGGVGRINLDLHTVATTVYVRDSASSSTDTGLEPIRIKAVNAGNIAHVYGGRVGFATNSVSDTAQFATVNVTGPGAVANLGAGLTLATLYQSSGIVTVNNTITTVGHDGGDLTTQGDYTITTFNASGTVKLNHRKTAGNSITTLNLYDGAFIDLSLNAAAVAFGTIVVRGDATIKTNPANPGHLSWTTLTRERGTLTIL